MNLAEKINNIFKVPSIELNTKKLTYKEQIILLISVITTVIIKIYLIPYNMMDMGDSATRVWNAIWWAENPYFILPESGHPLWFYFIGPIIKITGEHFYTAAITMIVLMTIGSFFIFKITLLFSEFKTALISFFIVTLNPVIFRLNFEPYAQQQYLAAACISVYYILIALSSDKSKKYFIIAGFFSFIALASRPEAIFLIAAICISVFLTKKNGYGYYILISLIFQIMWIAVSFAVYGEPLKSLTAADQYTESINIQGLNLSLRLKGFLLPYYFIVIGITLILFYFFIKGLIINFKKYLLLYNIILIIPIIIPALVNGAAGAKSTIYHTTHYIYLIFFFSAVFTAIGLVFYTNKIKNIFLQYALTSVIIISCIPLSYIKEFVPEKYSSLFPKIIQFFVTADEPEESWKLIGFIDENINQFPALIFDSDDNTSSIFYIPYRSKLVPPKNLMISSYNIPVNKDDLIVEIRNFIKRNPKGIIIYRKNSPTLMNSIFSEWVAAKSYIRSSIFKAMETDKWIILKYNFNEVQ